MNDTIAAISTALGVGAISIVRVSGDDALDIVSKIFRGKNLKEVESHTINYGYIYDNEKYPEHEIRLIENKNTFEKRFFYLILSLP